MDWIRLIQDRDQRRALVNKVMNIRIPRIFRQVAHNPWCKVVLASKFYTVDIWFLSMELASCHHSDT